MVSDIAAFQISFDVTTIFMIFNNPFYNCNFALQNPFHDLWWFQYQAIEELQELQVLL